MATKDKAPEPAPAPKRKSKFKIVLIILVLLIALIGGAIAFWWFQLREPSAPAPASNAAATAPAGSEHGAPAVVEGGAPAPAGDLPRPALSTVSLPKVMVNLADAAGDRYLTVGMDVELSSPDAAQEIQNQSAKIRDAIIILLSSKSYASLATAEGKLQLKNEVASRLNQILGTPRVVRIYFTEFVVQ